MKTISRALVLSLGMTVVAPVMATNLVANGSFEEPVVSGWKIFPDSSQTGWNISFGPGLEIQHGVAGDPYDGDQLAELDSRGSSGIYQDLDTTPFRVYLLEFAFSPRPRRWGWDNRLGILWDDQLLDELQANGRYRSNTKWTTHSYLVGACGTATRLEFQDLGRSNRLGTYIDAVSVTEVSPEDLVAYYLEMNPSGCGHENGGSENGIHYENNCCKDRDSILEELFSHCFEFPPMPDVEIPSYPDIEWPPLPLP